MTCVYVWHPIASCPLELIPKRVVERHGASLSVLCRPTTTSAEPDIIGWEAPIGLWNLNMPDNKSATWNVEQFEDWTFEPFCFGTFSDRQCSVTLPITLYSELKSSTSNNDNILINVIVFVIPYCCFDRDSRHCVHLCAEPQWSTAGGQKLHTAVWRLQRGSCSRPHCVLALEGGNNSNTHIWWPSHKDAWKCVVHVGNHRF